MFGYRADPKDRIRPLQTSDLRVRRVSGRHQISEDGKHLIDGVAFGRQYLRKTSRPAVRIPPRKRRRVTCDEDEYDLSESPENNQQIVVRAGFEDADAPGFEEEENDENFDPGDQGDLDEEIQNLLADSNEQDSHYIAAGGRTSTRRRTRSDKSAQGLGILPLIDDNGEPFVGQYSNPLLDRYSQYQPYNMTSALKVRKHHKPSGDQFTRSGMKGNLQDSSATPEPKGRRDSTGSNKSVRFEDQEVATPATVRESQVSDDQDDEDDDSDFEPNEVNGSDKENAPPRLRSQEAIEDDEDASDTSSSTFSEFDPSDSESTSSSGTSSSSSSDSEPEDFLTPNLPTNKEHSDTSSSATSSSDDESDSKPDRSQLKSDVSPITSIDEIESSQPKIPQQMNPPGTGKLKTRKRNQRRREYKLLNKLKGKGILPSGATNKDLYAFREAADTTKSGRDNEERQENANADPTDFELKRKALLDSLATGGTEIEEGQTAAHASAGQQHESSVTLAGVGPPISEDNESDLALRGSEGERDETKNSPVVQVRDSLEHPAWTGNKPVNAPGDESQGLLGREGNNEGDEDPNLNTTPRAANAVQNNASSLRESRRSRLDLESSRRLLFGSLGVKTPKSKEDEAKVQAKLMQDVRPLPQPKAETQASETADKVIEYDDDSWKEKIILRAVECCGDEIEYSTPPFPFVQRWDPQQQRGYGISKSQRKKGKKRKRNDKQYYENQYDDSFNEYEQTKSPRRQDYKPATAELNFHDIPTDDAVGVQEDSAEQSGNLQDAQVASDQLLNGTIDNVESAELAVETHDLPTLPEDSSAWLPLKVEACKAGAVIAFKKFEMSVADGWQPYISEHRTAMVNCLNEDGSVEMTWAKRDQPQRQEKYDDLTGERIYGKFEMPGFQESEGEDSSKVTVMFSELIEPILVRAANDVPAGLDRDMDGHQKPTSTEVLGDDTINRQLNKASGDEQVADAEVQASIGGLDIPVKRQCQVPGRDSMQQKLNGALAAQSKINFGASQMQGPTGGFADNTADDSQPGTQARHEISKMIKDAGWRSSVGSDIDPKLNIEARTPDLDHDESPSKKLSSPKLDGYSSSLPPHDSDCLSPIRSLGESSHGDANEIAESFPSKPDIPDSPHSLFEPDNSVSYPSLPLFDVDDETTAFISQRQHRSVSLSASPSHDKSPSLISPPALRRRGHEEQPNSPTPQPTSNSQVKKKPQLNNSIDGAADSDSEEFPTLFSQRFEERLSQSVEPFKRETSHTSDLGLSPARPSKAKSRPKSKSNAKAQPNSNANSSRLSSQRLPSKRPTWQMDEDESFRPSQQRTQSQISQIPPSSQIIDLTQASSDPIRSPEYGLDDEEGDESWKPESVSAGSSLPTGSGWMPKSSKVRRRTGGW